MTIEKYKPKKAGYKWEKNKEGKVVTKRIALRGLSVLLLLVLVLTACAAPSSTPAPLSTQPSTQPPSSTQAPSSTQTLSPTQAPSSTTAPAKDTPVRGGTLIVMHAGETTNPGFPPNISGNTREYIDPIFDRLIYTNEKLEYEPCLATSWKTTADGLTITLIMRQGVKFHDGTIFDAAAAKWNIDNVITAGKMTGVSSTEVVDASTVKINLTAPNNIILFQLANDVACYIYSPAAYEKNGKDWAANNAVGTGPFKQQSYNRATGFILVRNPDYWRIAQDGKSLPYLDGIEMRTVTDEMTQITAFKSGQAHLMWNAQPVTANQLKDEANIMVAPGACATITFDSKNNKLFTDPKVKAAMEYAIDKEGITSGPGYGLFKPKYQVFNEQSPAFNKSLPPRKYDIAKAKQLLTEAGYPDGISFKVEVQSTTWKDGIVAVQASMAKAGIKMDINYLPTAQFNLMRNTGKIDSGDAGMMTINLQSDPLYVLNFFFRSDAGQYQYFTRPSGTDALLDVAKATQDKALVYKNCQEVVKLLYDDVTFVPMWDTARIAIYSKSLQNPGFFVGGDANNNRVGIETWLKK